MHLQHETTYKPINGNVGQELPVGSYTIMLTNEGFVLSKVESLPYKPMVGQSIEIEDLVLKHCEANPDDNCGFIFSGISGMGKTRTINNICHKLNLPVIYINEVYELKELLPFLNSWNTKLVLVFDEIEKVYGHNESENILGLFDGLPTQKPIISFISMNKEDVTEYFFGRPGRFVFNFEHLPLDTDEAMSLIEIPDAYKESVRNYFDKISNLSYDIVFKFKQQIDIHGWNKVNLIAKYFNVVVCNFIYTLQINTVVKGKLHSENRTVDAYHFDESNIDTTYWTRVGHSDTGSRGIGILLSDIKDSIDGPVDILTHCKKEDSHFFDEFEKVEIELIKRKVTYKSTRLTF